MDNPKTSPRLSSLAVGRLRAPSYTTELGAAGSREAGAGNVIVEGFNERQQQLSIVFSSVTGMTGLVPPGQLDQFQLELRNYHQASGEALVAQLGSDATRGITVEGAAAKLKEVGPNTVKPPRPWPLWLQLLLIIFTSGFSPLLWFATFWIFLSWEPFGVPPSNAYSLVLAITLIIFITISGLLTFWQEQATSSVLKALKSMVASECVVIRGGEARTVPAADLVPGDLVEVQSGMVVPADMRAIAASGLRLNTSMLTGEAEPVRVTAAVVPPDSAISLLEANNIMFQGTTVLEGSGRAIVFATGNDNQLSKIMKSASSVKKPVTSLQKEVNIFVARIAMLAFVTGVIVIAVWGGYLHVQHPGFMPVPAMISNAISVIIAFVPEGLPLALSIGLTIIARRMCLEYAVLVKTLGSIETLGSTSFIASDKTGTLTQNLMTATTVIVARGSDGSSPATACVLPTSEVTAAVAAGGLFSRCLAVSVLCNPASVREADSEGAAGAAAPEVVGGNGIDKALLQWALALGGGTPAVVSALTRAYERRARVPFSSVTKVALEVVREAAPGGACWVMTKGAPEAILERCASAYVLPSGPLAAPAADAAAAAGAVAPPVHQPHTVPLTPDLRADLAAALERGAAQGLRVIALAERRLPPADFPREYAFDADAQPGNFPVDELVFVGLVAVTDPPRPGVKEAVGQLRAAGIRVAMVTGDTAITAVAIAQQVGIVTAELEPIPPHLLLQAPAAASAAPTARAPLGVSAATFSAPGAADDAQATTAAVPAAAAAVTPSAPSKDAPSKDQDAPSEVVVVSGAQAAGGGSGPRAASISGPQLRQLGPAGWAWLLEHEELVFARTTPEQKLQIVNMVKASGHRVAVTGDGVNDAPALKAADIGVAMNSGSDVSREAATIVLLKDTFTSVVDGVREGRLVFTNLRKAVAYQMTAGSMSEILPVVANFFFGVPQALSSFLMIVICCMTDVCGCIALIFEPPEAEIMLERPRNLKKDPLVTPQVFGYAYLFFGILESLAAFVQFFTYMYYRGPLGTVADPLPSDDDPNGNYGSTGLGYAPHQLVFAWNFGATSNSGSLYNDELAAWTTGSSVYFVTLIICQLGHLLSMRRKDSPYFSEVRGATLWQWLRNAAGSIRIMPTVLLAWAAAIITTVLFTEVPGLQTLCGTAHVPGVYWGYSFMWAIAVFVIAEARKWVIVCYPKGWVARTTGF